MRYSLSAFDGDRWGVLASFVGQGIESKLGDTEASWEFVEDIGCACWGISCKPYCLWEP